MFPQSLDKKFTASYCFALSRLCSDCHAHTASSEREREREREPEREREREPEREIERERDRDAQHLLEQFARIVKPTVDMLHMI